MTENSEQVRELTQRIGELCRQVNERDRTIALMAQLVDELKATVKTVRLQLPDLIGADDVLQGESK